MNYLVHNLFNEFVNWIEIAKKLIETYYESNTEIYSESKETVLNIFDSKIENLMLWVIENENLIKNENELIDNINTLFDKIGNLGIWLNTYIHEDDNIALVIFRRYKAADPLSRV